MSLDALYELVDKHTPNETNLALAYAHGALVARIGEEETDKFFATLVDAFNRDRMLPGEMRDRMITRFGEEPTHAVA